MFNPKMLCGTMAVCAVIATTDSAMADSTAEPYRPVVEDYRPSSNSLKLGMVMDMSAPSGMALGLQTRLPYLPWFKWSFAGTYTLAPGLRGGVLFDPIQFPVVPVLNVETGHQYPITIPVSGRPNVDFNYTDLEGGLAFGSRDHTRFVILAGMSYINGAINNVQGVLPSVSGLTIGDANFHGWVPCAKMGAEFLF